MGEGVGTSLEATVPTGRWADLTALVRWPIALVVSRGASSPSDLPRGEESNHAPLRRFFTPCVPKPFQADTTARDSRTYADNHITDNQNHATNKSMQQSEAYAAVESSVAQSPSITIR